MGTFTRNPWTVKLVPHGLEVICARKGKDVVLRVENSSFNRMDPMKPWFEDGAIVECRYMTWESPMWWQPLKRRRDKNHPNNRRTFYRTIVNIKEDIKMKEFLDCKPY